MTKLLIIPAAALAGLGYFGARRMAPPQLQRLAQNLDVQYFNGFFAFNNISPAQIAALWLVESSGNPLAVNRTGGDGLQGGSWGLGQVTARTSKDYGVIAPQLMLFGPYGALVSMRHIRQTVLRLRSNGRSGAAPDWVLAYNAGVTGFLRSGGVPSYLTAWRSALNRVRA